MNALALAEYLEDLFDADGEPKKAAAMLRRQREAIKVLRSALEEIKGYVLEHGAEYAVAEQALQETSEFSK